MTLAFFILRIAFAVSIFALDIGVIALYAMGMPLHSDRVFEAVCISINAVIMIVICVHFAHLFTHRHSEPDNTVYKCLTGFTALLSLASSIVITVRAGLHPGLWVDFVNMTYPVVVAGMTIFFSWFATCIGIASYIVAIMDRVPGAEKVTSLRQIHHKIITVRHNTMSSFWTLNTDKECPHEFHPQPPMRTTYNSWPEPLGQTYNSWPGETYV